ncbi:LysR substrate-binding domain-containing protein [Serratia ficaria]|uniref:D-malate degradation protein R n=1 Tax=Serratia ficaria TaxID=61651 RepID=A0A240C0X3_SERFI|nr:MULTISPECIES: LysR family transcriptional regulator [Serratia]MEE4482244.1 LysR substrate-binding domain-containing protein [Serratia ficaria]REF44728.1 DNA-binding transcriptional LysR family regulator [Serratia ficaria]CAI0809674.1 D-malate degradation protein R [Serratia ficaria]CAI0816316.1 D-malate degradation protein R [Serratia ficaria]CAI0823048.1 D-malate degradation protein R [Serratia ficaria]
MHDSSTINFRALSFFISVFEAQSFSVVARREGVSASMISRVILQLEDALGQQLFYRNTRAVIPTEAGRLFVEYARAMTEQLSEARKELLDRSLEPAGTVRINAPVFFGQRHIAPWLPALSRRYPRLAIELTQTDDYIDPHREASDVIFRIGALTDSSFHARVFGTQRYHLAASPAYLQRHGEPAAPADLHHHRSLVYRGSSGPNRWLFREPDGAWIHSPISALLISNNAESLLTAALGGMGMVLFPDWLIGDSIKKGELVRLMPHYQAAINTEPLQIAAIYPHARHPPLNVRAVIDYFVEVYGAPLYWQFD